MGHYIWVPHPRRAFVLAARVGLHEFWDLGWHKPNVRDHAVRNPGNHSHQLRVVQREPERCYVSMPTHQYLEISRKRNEGRGYELLLDLSHRTGYGKAAGYGIILDYEKPRERK
jgi:hypothetical protein